MGKNHRAQPQSVMIAKHFFGLVKLNGDEESFYELWGRLLITRNIWGFVFYSFLVISYLSNV